MSHAILIYVKISTKRLQFSKAGHQRDINVEPVQYMRGKKHQKPKRFMDNKYVFGKYNCSYLLEISSAISLLFVIFIN